MQDNTIRDEIWQWEAFIESDAAAVMPDWTLGWTDTSAVAPVRTNKRTWILACRLAGRATVGPAATTTTLCKHNLISITRSVLWPPALAHQVAYC